MAVLFVFSVLAGCLAAGGCGLTSAPDPIGALYDFTVTYQRTAIVKAENMDPTELFVVIDGAKVPFPLTKVNESVFQAQVTGLRANSGADDLAYAAYVVDPKRFEVDVRMGPYYYGRPHSVGDVILFKSRLTGAETQLTSIVPNTYLWNLPAKSLPRMAVFRLLEDGTLR